MVAKAHLTEEDLWSYRDQDLADAEKALKKAKEKLKSTQLKVVLECAHLHAQIAEAPYRKNDFVASMPPFRVCLRCGLHEEGWGSGYHMLRGEDGYNAAIEIDRDTAYKFRTLSVGDLAASGEQEDQDDD